MKTQAKRGHEGAVIIIVAASLVLLIAIAALAIDIGQLYASRNELQNAADAAALAACRKLGEVHKSGVALDEAVIKNVAIDVAAENVAAGESISISGDSIEVGCWNAEELSFKEDCSNSAWSTMKKNAVKVVAGRTGENGITTFFARVIGIDQVAVSADATAALSGLSKIDEGELIPVGISDYWYQYDWASEGKEFCGQPIKFRPTGNMEGCAGWHTFEMSPSNTDTLRGIFEGMLSTTPTPEASTEDYIVPTGGNISNAFCHPNKPDLEAVYLDRRDPITKEWKASVVVYEAGDCSNPNQNMNILGFSTAIITNVNCDDDIIEARVICDEYQDERGGGGMYGTFGTIPGLVK